MEERIRGVLLLILPLPLHSRMALIGWTVAVAVVVYLVVSWFLKRRALINIIDKIPGFKTNPLLGNVIQMGDGTKPEAFKYLSEAMLAFRRMYRSWVGPIPLISAVHPDTAKTMLNDTYSKAWNYRLFETFLGKHNLFIRTGDFTKRMRRIHTPMFHFTMLKTYLKDFVPATSILVEKWSKQVGKSVDLPSNLGPLSLDIILRSAFGFNSGCQEKEIPYLGHVKALTEFIIMRTFNPLLWSDFIFNLSPMGRKNKVHADATIEFCGNLIKQRRIDIDKARADGTLTEENRLSHPLTSDYIGQFIMYKDEDGTLTDDEIISSTQGIVFAAHDTTACALTFVLHCLSRYPKMQDKVREELLEVCGEDLPTLDNLADLKYMQMFIHEVMRMYPPVPLLGRTSDKDMTIDGHFVPANHWLEIGVWSTHHNPDVWPEPEKFDPERFSPENREHRNPYAWLPFAGGNRSCLGQKYAIMEMKVVISMILQKFYLLQDPESPEPTIVNYAVITSTTPMRVILEAREEGSMRQTASIRSKLID